MSSKVAIAFLDRLHRSGLVSENKVPQLREDLEQRGVDLDAPGAVADALVEDETLTRWQAEKLLQGKHKGFFLGSYRLLRPLGKGGMGAVFLAEHEMMRRRCAIKVLPHSSIKEGSSVLQRFYVEAQAVAALDHQNIVRAYDVSKEIKDKKEIHYLVMEYVDGDDIQGMVNESGEIDCIKAADFVRQTANGLAHAHENGLVHRDIKPANLLVDTKGVVKILDLGLARFFDDSDEASLTKEHNETVLGTADYLSPEQALNSHDVDHRTDIYSLGCTAYFMLTGHPPFPEGTVAQRLVAHQVKTPTPITDERADAPADLVAIVDKMMDKKAEERFQTASEIATTLSAWLIEHGGEEWKRRHSEIAGDSGLLRMLSQREPTRAMSSPTAETAELGLAPLADDAPKPADSSVAKGSGSSIHDDIALAPDEDEVEINPEAAGEVELPPLEEPDEVAPLAADEPLADLAAMGELPSLDEAEMLGSLDSLGGDDMLSSLDAADLGSLDQEDLEPAGSEDPLGAIQSDLQLPVTASPHSSTRLRQDSAVTSKPAQGGIKSIGLPILIGIVGGLLLVGIIILFFMFSTSDDPAPVRPFVPPGPVAEDPKEQPDDPPKEPIEEKPDVAPKQPGTGDEKADTKPKKTGRKGKQSTEQPADPPKKDGDGHGTQEVVKPPTKPDDPPADPLEKTPKKDGSIDPDDALAKVDPKPPEVAPLSDAERKKMFAEIEVISVDWKADMGTEKKKQPKPNPVLNQVGMICRQKLEDATEKLKWGMGTGARSVLTLTIAARTDRDMVALGLMGDLKVTDANSQSHSVWTHQAPIAQFSLRASPTTVYGMVRKEAGKFFDQLERDHRKAVEEAGGN
ncbi:MAG: protein kinase [Planctomycetes bacterium]|nr:protein kinase [Planctomycetota bacterium]MBL7037125.1 protein kinase [Pirellulaceae bacterium]